jgi:cyanate lyase
MRAFAKKVVKRLGLFVPTYPLIYSFSEIMQVYGMPIKSVIGKFIP